MRQAKPVPLLGLPSPPLFARAVKDGFHKVGAKATTEPSQSFLRSVRERKKFVSRFCEMPLDQPHGQKGENLGLLQEL